VAVSWVPQGRQAAAQPRRFRRPSSPAALPNDGIRPPGVVWPDVVSMFVEVAGADLVFVALRAHSRRQEPPSPVRFTRPDGGRGIARLTFALDSQDTAEHAGSPGGDSAGRCAREARKERVCHESLDWVR
jgi:hypothetical protein